MASLDEIKDLLRKEIAPINGKLDNLTSNLEKLKDAVKFLSDKYDDLLDQIKSTNEKIHHQAITINNIKEDTNVAKKSAVEAKYQVEELAQYIRRDCLEISGIQPTNECTCETIVSSVGKAIGVPVTREDISITHPIPSFNAEAPPKFIVKFTRRDVRNKFYGSRKKLASKKAKDLPDLELDSEARVYISENLTPYKKKLFGDVNKIKKRRKWKFIWTYNGRIFLKEDESTQTFTFDTEEDLAKIQDGNRHHP